MIHPNRRAVLCAGIAVAGLLAWPGAASAQVRNVLDTLAADGRFNRFIDLIGRAGLSDTLRGPGPFTLLAPTDAAFVGAPASLVEDLTSQGSGGSGGGTLSGESTDPIRLRAFVQYHVIQGQAWTLAQWTGGERQIRTVNGSSVLVRAVPGTPVTISNPTPGQGQGLGAAGLNVMPPAGVIQADIPASNGVVHALGGVLFP